MRLKIKNLENSPTLLYNTKHIVNPLNMCCAIFGSNWCLCLQTVDPSILCETSTVPFSW
jgi:hypothetical protein